jgi:hypothetical protein
MACTGTTLTSMYFGLVPTVICVPPSRYSASTPGYLLALCTTFDRARQLENTRENNEKNAFCAQRIVRAPEQMVLKIGTGVAGRRQSGIHIKRHSGYHDSEVHSTNSRISVQLTVPGFSPPGWERAKDTDTEGSGPNPKAGLDYFVLLHLLSVSEAR